MINTKNLDKEIQRYYKISVFVNKYISIILAFFISILIVLWNSTSSTKILSYSSNINLFMNKKIWKDVQEDLNNFNKKSKYIKSSLLLTKSKIRKNSIKLWYGIFYDKYGYYYPSNVVLSNKYYFRYIVLAKKHNFIAFLKTLKNWNQKFSIPRLKLLSDSDVIKNYNLSCLDSFTSNSIFCNYNKNKLLSDLLNKPSFEISKNMYWKLFSSLNYDDEKKCSLLVALYLTKYNYSTLSDLINSKCDDNTIEKLAQANKLKNIFIGNYFNFSKKANIKKYVYLTQLVNQMYYIVKKGNLTSEKIDLHFKFIEYWLSKLYIDPKMAIAEIKVLDFISQKNSSDSIRASIDKLRKWWEFIKKWLDDIANTDIEEHSDIIISDDTRIIRSKKEKLQIILNENYSDVFIPTTIKQIDGWRKLFVKWRIILSYKTDSKIFKKYVSLSFYVKNVDIDTFDISDLKILDNKVNDYLNWRIPHNYNNLDSLQNILHKKLLAPFVYNDWSKENVKWKNICDKFKKHNISCKNNVVTIGWKELAYKWKIKIKLKFNKNEEVEKVIVDEPLEIYLDNIIKEKIKLSASKISKLVNFRIKNLPFKGYEQVIKEIKKIIDKQLKKIIRVKVWLTSLQEDTLIDRFKNFLWVNIELIRKLKWNTYAVYFKKDNKLFIALYKFKSNIIKTFIIQDIQKWNKFIFKNVNLKLSSLNQSTLNQFKLDYKSYLKEKNSKEFEKMEKYFKKSN